MYFVLATKIHSESITECDSSVQCQGKAKYTACVQMPGLYLLSEGAADDHAMF